MALSGIIHGLLFVLEDFFAWKLGELGIPFWVVVVVGFLIAYFFWGKLIILIKTILGWVGIGK